MQQKKGKTDILPCFTCVLLNLSNHKDKKIIACLHNPVSVHEDKHKVLHLNAVNMSNKHPFNILM